MPALAPSFAKPPLLLTSSIPGMAPSDNGISRGSVLTDTTLKAIIVFISLAFYNVGELGFIILATFKRRGGLYFWSFIVATCGIALYGLGFLIKALQLDCPSWLYTTLIVIGWYWMVTGQSLVLYSRLHLLLRNEFRLRLVLAMIITNAVICHVPITVMVYGANSSNPEPFILPYSVYEKVQVTLFFLQETIISGLYIYETVALMRSRNGLGARSGATRWLLTHLIIVNIIIVVLDVTILGLEYADLYGLQTSYKALVYSVKLKLEFSILNRLVELTTQGGSHGHDSSYLRTGAEASGVQMDTFEKERRRRNRARDSAMGNTVHVGSGVGAGAEDIRPTGASVVMTTEVTVQRRNRLDADTDLDGDLESIGDRSGRAVGSIAGDIGGQSRPPSHSSERQIIERHDS